MKRIHELTELRNYLRKKGCESRITELGLDRRIKLLYDENLQMKEVKQPCRFVKATPIHSQVRQIQASVLSSMTRVRTMV